MNISLETLTNILDGKCLSREDVAINSVSIDTRSMVAGCAYIAIIGDVFDGHDFISDAVSKGAAVIVSERALDAKVPVIVVENTRHALGQVAAYWRNQFDIPVIGITGSNGKTTVKEICRSILQEAGNVVATEKNNNNDIGVPLTLFQINEKTDFAVIEMGTNHKGEIGYLAQIVKPTVAAITNIGESHLAGFKTKDAVAKEKSEIFNFMTESSRAVISSDGEFADFLSLESKPATLVTFSNNGAGDICVKQLNNGKVDVIDNADKANFQCGYRLLGAHNLSNLACAIAITGGLKLAADAYIQGVENCEPVPGRLEPIRINKNLLIINDSYNANPSSVKQAINVLDDFEGYKVFVFGDMGELGDKSKSYHKDIGAHANTKSIDLLITIGDLSREIASTYSGLHKHLDTHQQVVDEILSLNEENTVVLVKASRFMGLDKVVNDVKLKAA